uniref:alpha/beta hydrolase n=1 Tax=Herbidospora sakaeratensis TaxID=564415 RepID=UPI001470981E|nr:alpha/beta hydrolase family protein [Herbidospora sakaeratensis]
MTTALTPRVADTVAVDDRQDLLTIASAALGREALVWVLKPAGWTPGSTGWPVLYLLHGCCEPTGDTWLTKGEAARVTAGLKAVVVVPEGGTDGWYADWLDGPKWETFHLKEMLPLVEDRYGVGGRRAVAGLSMGGHGAMGYAARNPGVFEAAASFSGVLDIRMDVPGFSSFLKDNGADPDKLWGPLPAREDNWRAHNPADLADRLKDLRLYVSSGNGEPGEFDEGDGTDFGEQSILRQNQRFLRAARLAGLTVETDLYGNGKHDWPYWTRALERALPTLLPEA